MHSISNTVTRKFIDSIDLSNLEIETDDGWQPINAIHKTVPYDVWYIKTSSGLTLECADTHIVFDENQNEIFIKDIKGRTSGKPKHVDTHLRAEKDGMELGNPGIILNQRDINILIPLTKELMIFNNNATPYYSINNV